MSPRPASRPAPGDLGELTSSVEPKHVLTGVDDRLRTAVDGVRRRACGVAVALSVEGESSFLLDQGSDVLTSHSLFEVGSVTKTLTALVLATAVIGGEVDLEATVGDMLGTAAGRAEPITLLQLATHTSGLPRMAPNHRVHGDDAGDPYARFDEKRLLAALQLTPRADAAVYSNLGFQLLGYVLERVLDQPLAHLFQARIFDPLGMADTRCGTFLESDHRLPGYGRDGVVPFWSPHLPGPGGVSSSIRDLAGYVAAMYDPPDRQFGRAVALASSFHAQGPYGSIGLAWMCEQGLWCHRGTTAGFGCFLAFDRRSRAGVALAVNSGGPVPLRGEGLRLLEGIVRSRRPHSLDFHGAYAGRPGWDIDRPQPAMLALAQAGVWRGRVLDVGCGTGEHALLAARLGLDATGIDSAPTAIDHARKKATDRGLPARFLVADALHLGDLGTFDTVIDSGLFHVFEDDERQRYVERLHEVVRPGGILYLLCFSDRQVGRWPPRRVSSEEIRASFATAWHVDWIQPATFDLTGSPGRSDPAIAWLAKIDRR